MGHQPPPTHYRRGRGEGGGTLSRSIISLISDGIKLLFIYFVDKMCPRLIDGRETRAKYFSKEKYSNTESREIFLKLFDLI